MSTKAIFVIIATLAVIGLSFFLALYIGSRGKKNSDSSDWNIGGRDLPLYVIVGTQFASAMGGGVIVGQVGNAYTNGIASLAALLRSASVEDCPIISSMSVM